MKVSLIIVTFNQHDVLRECLKSCLGALKGLDAGVDGEIIVVDNASTDATAQVLADEFPTVRHVRNTVNLYYTRAVNQGMRAAKGEWVYLLNDDIELAPNGVQALLDFVAAHPKCGAVGPAMFYPDGRPGYSAHKFPTPTREILNALGVSWLFRNKQWADWMQKEYRDQPGTQQVDWICGGAIMLPRELIASLGHHDEHYLFYRDDPDIGMRLRAKGYEVWHCADTKVLHHHGKSTVKTPRKLRFSIIDTRSRRHYHRKFHGFFASFCVEAAYGASYLLKMVRRTLTGQFAEAKKMWGSFVLLFESLAMPEEEKMAYEGYRTAPFNGMNEQTHGERAAPAFAETGSIAGGKA